MSSATAVRGFMGTPKPPRATGQLIVLIDDNQSWAEATAELLRGVGFEVEAVEDGQSGLELLSRLTPCLVILDVHLPGVGGMEVLHELRRQCRQLPVLMISGEDQADLMVRALAEGASAFLRKPASADLLLRAVHRLVGFSGRHAENEGG